MSAPRDPSAVKRRNVRLHFVEGALYIASLGILNVQTVYPSLVRHLGGSEVAVGLLPVIAYGAYFLPQILGANLTTRHPYRRPFILKISLLQRFAILLLGVSVGLLGAERPGLALAVFFVAFAVNQMLGGVTAPAWFDFLAKTVPPGMRGRVIGLRSSSGGFLSFLSSLLLTAIFVSVPFPLSYSIAFAAAFVWQLSSYFVLRQVVEEEPSPVQQPLAARELFTKIRSIISENRVFRRFLAASALSTVGLLPAAFFTVSAFEQLHLEDSAVGVFTMITVGSQVLSALALGWLGDRKGYKSTLLVCAGSIIGATLMAIAARELWMWYPVFALVGVSFGAEMMLRFNFAVDCAPEHDRPIYIGVLNVWLAPWYLTNVVGGWVVHAYGYGTLFVIGLAFSVSGFLLLSRVRDPRRSTSPDSLALSSK